MMLAIFAFLTMAFLLDFLDLRRPSTICLAASALVLTLCIFAWERCTPGLWVPDALAARGVRLLEKRAPVAGGYRSMKELFIA